MPEFSAFWAYTLKQGQINPAVVEMKARFDPQGLLNPGKLRGWEQRTQPGGSAEC